jgi:hypothetical protein
MNIEIKPVLAGMIGILILLIPVAVQTTEHFPPLLPEKSIGEETNGREGIFHVDTNNMRGLYGYRYRGF